MWRCGFDMKALIVLLVALPLISGQTISTDNVTTSDNFSTVTTFDDIHTTDEGYYMNGDKCFCPGLGGSCYGECGRKYDAAEVASVEAFKYGRFETRLFPSIEVDGTVATFFLFKNDTTRWRGRPGKRWISRSTKFFAAPVDPSLKWAGHWAGVFDEKHTKLPLTVYYDYVKVYDYDLISKGFLEVG
ncbi:unnamed protein product [Vitrella brassicaformis CCMP3155]|uniref:GH16 domain-containing protein n=1 Tax=Vitrella brassicaformis (strain CCMP3155) TaxID=1169540 RepID=A0A0G4GBR4_VITBC|nr:unnamed protein product [Vitrella brassicaformis CCMP3155]|eukprot:CEM26580.1 unnamed protein product [Vitrella brassicaformis CCMP3155]